MADLRDTLILDIDQALRQVLELENALNRALGQLVIDVDVSPSFDRLEDDLRAAAQAADAAADEAGRIDRELDQADRSADDLKDAMRGVEKAADRAADETKKIDKAGKDATKSFGELGKSISEGFDVKKLGLGVIAAVGLAEIRDFLISSVTAATDLSESINAVQVVFGDASEQVLQFGADTTDAVFLAASEFNQLAAVTGTLLQGFGLNVQDVADITIVLTRRAADLASVFNTSVAEAMEAINAALRGETEQIRRFTGSFSIDEVKAFGRELFDVTGALTSQQTALAAVEFLLVKTDQVQGDAANTAGELANQQRALAEVWGNAQAIIGEALVPAIEELLPLIPDLIDAFVDLVPILEASALVIADTAIELLDMLDPLLAVVGAISDLAGAGSEAEEETSNAAKAIGALRVAADAGRRVTLGFGLTLNTLIGFAAGAAGASSDAAGDVETFAEALLEIPIAGSDVVGTGADLVDSAAALADEALAAAIAVDTEADAFRESAFFGAAFAKAQQEFAGDVDDATEAIDDQTRALQELAEEQASAADPLIDFIRDLEDFAAAQAEVAEIEAAGAERADELTGAFLDQIETGGDLRVSAARIADALDLTIGGFRDLAISVGLPRDVVQELLEFIFEIPPLLDIGVDFSDIEDLERRLQDLEVGVSIPISLLTAFDVAGRPPQLTGPIPSPPRLTVPGDERVAPQAQSPVSLTIIHPIDPDIAGNAAQAANMIGAIVGATGTFAGRS